MTSAEVLRVCPFWIDSPIRITVNDAKLLFAAMDLGDSEGIPFVSGGAYVEEKFGTMQ